MLVKYKAGKFKAQQWAEQISPWCTDVQHSACAKLTSAAGQTCAALTHKLTKNATCELWKHAYPHADTPQTHKPKKNATRELHSMQIECTDAFCGTNSRRIQSNEACWCGWDTLTLLWPTSDTSIACAVKSATKLKMHNIECLNWTDKGTQGFCDSLAPQKEAQAVSKETSSQKSVLSPCSNPRKGNTTLRPLLLSEHCGNGPPHHPLGRSISIKL